jgi:hypothetical protein
MALWITGTAALCPICSTKPNKMWAMRLWLTPMPSETSPRCPQTVGKPGQAVVKVARRRGIMGKTHGLDPVREIVPWFIRGAFHRVVHKRGVCKL